MNNVEKIVLVSVILVLLVGGGFIVFAQDKNRESVKETPSMSHDMSSSSETVSKIDDLVDLTSDSEVKIDIDSSGYKDENIKIKLGTEVTWTNQDVTEHNTMPGRMDDTQSHHSSNSEDGLTSPLLKKGESYSYTFIKPGDYPYHCSKHPVDTGNIKVVE